MSRVAETVPELWLNRKGYFTIRGLKTFVKDGHGEIDLVGYHPHKKKAIHIEVSASPDPSGFLGGEVAARIPQGIAKFVEDKYKRENVVRVRQATCPPETKWKWMLAHGYLKREDEVRAALEDNCVTPISLFTMLTELSEELPHRVDADAATMPVKLSEKLPYRVDTDAAYFAYLAAAYAKRSP